MHFICFFIKKIYIYNVLILTDLIKTNHKIHSNKMEVNPDNLDSLEEVLSYFYKKLQYLEKMFFYLFLADMLGYAILYIAFLLLTGEILINFPFILFIFFPIISGITMVCVFYL